MQSISTLEDSFYVYVLCDPTIPGKYIHGEFTFDYEPFYIGKGRGIRMYTHSCNSHLKNTKTIKRAKLVKIKKAGLKPIKIKLFKNLTEEDAFQKETELIFLIGRRDLGLGTLCNLTNGGEGNSGRVMSEEEKKQRSEAVKGKPQSKEHGRKVSAALKGIVRKEEYKKKVSLGVKTYYDEHGPSNTKSVVNLTLGKIYSSVNEASTDVKGTAGCISAVCKGARKSHKKCLFKYLNDVPNYNGEIIHPDTKKKKPVGKSGVTGVCFNKAIGYWTSVISIDKKKVVKYSKTKEEAIIKRKELELLLQTCSPYIH